MGTDPVWMHSPLPEELADPCPKRPGFCGTRATVVPLPRTTWSTRGTFLSLGLYSTSCTRNRRLDRPCKGPLEHREDKCTGSAGGCPQAVCYVSNSTVTASHTSSISYYPTSLSNGILCCGFQLTLTYFFLVSLQAVRSYQSTGSWNKHSLRGKARLYLVNLISFV